jgi:hypothetical protein
VRPTQRRGSGGNAAFSYGKPARVRGALGGGAAALTDLGRAALRPRLSLRLAPLEGGVTRPPSGAGPLCPGCQYAEWHPHCTSLVDADDERVDLSSMPQEEWDETSITRCEYIDLDVSWIDDADEPQGWRCARCGGSEFEGVHRD